MNMKHIEWNDKKQQKWGQEKRGEKDKEKKEKCSKPAITFN